ncbi:MAG: filamentous hemagglutinin N-terminal domain-containing protein [Thermosynechococcaceae cyanobacterium]
MLSIGLCLSVAIKEASAQSQLTPDRTLGAESSRVEPQIQPTPTDLITGGARRGQNLFHSFADFNVAPGQSIFFSNPNGVTNILTRVTGNHASQIESTLGVQGDANLFLINPNGITFGPKASLDVGGSFVATTANAIQFNQESFFRATSPEQSVLLTIQPSAFFFNQSNSGQITNQSQAFFGGISAVSDGARSTTGLGVPEGKSLLLVGGNINLNRGGLNSINGRVDIASVQAGQTLKINATDGELSLGSLPSAQAGDINLQRASVTNAGSRDTTEGARKGLIRFQGKNLALTDSSIRNTISNIPDPVEGNSTGIVLIAENIVLQDTSFSVAPFASSGPSGNIFIEADQFTAHESSLSTGAADQGTDGNITIKVRKLLSLEDSRLNTESATNFVDPGQSGDIKINAGEFIARNADLSTSTAGLGNGGNILIDVKNKILLENSTISSESNPSPAGPFADTGDAGDIEINTDELLSLGTNFSTSTSTQGNAGDITFNIGDRILLSSTTIFSVSRSSAMGDAGNIEINAKQLAGKSNSELATSTFGEGDAGSITVDVADTISLDHSNVISETVDATGNALNGNGGNIKISAKKLISRNSNFSTSTLSQGDAGDLTFKIDDQLLLTNSTISSGGDFQVLDDGSIFSLSEGTGDTGSIEIDARQLVSHNSRFLNTALGSENSGELTFNIADQFSLVDSTISSQNFILVEEGDFLGLLIGEGDAGNITINAKQLDSRNSFLSSTTFSQGSAGDLSFNISHQFLLDNSLILSDTVFDAGRGGSINIQTQQLQATNESEISAATFGSGAGGNLNIFASEGIELRSGSQLSVASEASASGNAGNLNVETQALTIADGAQVTVSSPQAQAGTLTIKANSLELNQGTISAETGESGQEGANINLQTSQTLTLSNESLISADAFGEANGGNILIDSPILLALPPEGSNGSDIIANAVDGRGGVISVNTQGLFGIEPRASLTPFNDITASSSTNLPGEVTLQTSEVDPSDNLINLTVRPPEVKVVKSCTPQQGRSDFVVTGKGGVPPTAQESLNQDAFQVGLVTLDAPADRKTSNPAAPRQQTASISSGHSVQQLNEAQGWTKNAEGRLVLIAAASSETIALPQPVCQG